jgi:hypothetical protein
MNNEAPTLTHSLQIIQEMIEKTKNNLRQNSFYFLLWGWLVFVAALAQFVLLYWVKYTHHYLVWNLMWIGIIISIVHGIRSSRKESVRTYLGETMKYFGMGLGILYVCMVFIFSKNQLWEHAFPFYILVYAFACFFMGSVMQFRPLVWGAICCLGIMAVSLYVAYHWQLLLLAAAVLVSYIIPGHLLQKQPA